VEKPKFLKVTISVPWELLKEFDAAVKRRGYSRSEAMREGMRMLLTDILRKEKLRGESK